MASCDTGLLSDQRHHALMFPYPVQGHIQPFMRLSKLLATNYGFTISFFNSEENHRRLLADRDEPASQEDRAEDAEGKPLDFRMLFLPDVLPSSTEVEQMSAGTHIEKSHVLLSKTFLNTDPAALETLIRSQSPPITCLILDPLVTVIAPGLGEKLGITSLIFFPASAASLATAIRSGEVDGDAKQMTRIVGAPVLDVKEVNPFLSICGRGHSDFMARLFTQPFRKKLIKANDIILINTVEELEESTLKHLQEENKVCAIGPVLPPWGAFAVPTLWSQDYSCLDWLDKQPAASVLFVSFGSLATLSSTQLSDLALGLEASNQRILWVTRPDQIYGKAPDLPSDFLERIKDRILVFSWVPQLHVLCHTSVGGFLSHCGWNSTIESIAAGVPILAWPFFGDQMLNAKCVVEKWRIGLALTGAGGAMSKAVVETRVKDLMEGDLSKELRNRAQNLKHIVVKALSHGGSSSSNLQKLFGHL
nr:glycosyltransferase [Odontosoria chusana]